MDEPLIGILDSNNPSSSQFKSPENHKHHKITLSDSDNEENQDLFKGALETENSNQEDQQLFNIEILKKKIKNTTESENQVRKSTKSPFIDKAQYAI